MNKIKPTSIDKVNGKFIKYKRGDCFAIDCGNSNYLGLFITEKFNKYYDFTFIEYLEVKKPDISNFTNGRFFGTRMGSLEDIEYVVAKFMVECKYVDSCEKIELIGYIELIDKIGKASYQYEKDIDALLHVYKDEIDIRIEKTKNAEKFPEIGFVSKHLIEMKNIIKRKDIFPYFQFNIEKIKNYFSKSSSFHLKQ